MSKNSVENYPEDCAQIEKVDATIEKGGKEIGTGVANIVSGTTTMVAKTIGAGVDFAGAGLAKVGELCTRGYNRGKKASKAEKARIRFEKGKNKTKKALKSVKTVGKGGFDAAKGTGRIAINSVKKSIKEMRAEEKIPETTQNPENVENQAA